MNMIWTVETMAYSHEGEYLETTGYLKFYSSRYKAENYCKEQGAKLLYKHGGRGTGNVWGGTYQTESNGNTFLQYEIRGHYIN